MTNKSAIKNNRTASTSAKVAKNRQVGEKRPLTVNPGDRVAKEPQTIEEKSKQLAVSAPDVTGDYIKVPTYFVVEHPNGKQEALHHVKDAKKISDMIRQARFEDEDWERQPDEAQEIINLTSLILILALFVFTIPVLIGIF